MPFGRRFALTSLSKAVKWTERIHSESRSLALQPKFASLSTFVVLSKLQNHIIGGLHLLVQGQFLLNLDHLLFEHNPLLHEFLFKLLLLPLEKDSLEAGHLVVVDVPKDEDLVVVLSLRVCSL